MRAAEDMFDRTNTREAPWSVIPADDKPAARAAALEVIANRLSAGIDLSRPAFDDKLIRVARRVIGAEISRGRRSKK